MEQNLSGQLYRLLLMKRKWLETFIPFLVILIIIIYLYSQQENLLTMLSNVSPLTFSLLITLQLVGLVTSGLLLNLFVLKFNVRLKSKEWFGLSVVTVMANYLTPFSGGMLARAAYLKQRHAFPYAQFVTMLSANYLITFWVVGCCGAISMLVYPAHFSIPIFILFVTVILGTSILTFLPHLRLPGKNWFIHNVNMAILAWCQVRDDRPLVLKLIGYTLINISVNGLSFWVAYAGLGQEVPFVLALLFGLLISFSILINITPGNLGVQEAVSAFSAEILGVGATEGLLAALIIRAALLVTVLTLGPIFSYLLTQELSTHKSNYRCSDK
ncbi:lysylphosphatidylglycerol synthase transmembrane domain-containing protein [Anaerolineales bacterium HSG24]|nr:lysylphosphatidylglycerol synthase transmembrane domain-containing protein [Anaerolineales bacterium HSG24]